MTKKQIINEVFDGIEISDYEMNKLMRKSKDLLEKQLKRYNKVIEELTKDNESKVILINMQGSGN